MSPHIHLQHEHLALVSGTLNRNKISSFAAIPQTLIPFYQAVPYQVVESCYHNYVRFGCPDSHPGQHQTEMRPTCTLPLPRRPSNTVSRSAQPKRSAERWRPSRSAGVSPSANPPPKSNRLLVRGRYYMPSKARKFLL